MSCSPFLGERRSTLAPASMEQPVLIDATNRSSYSPSLCWLT
jgi:hypothetical protein